MPNKRNYHERPDGASLAFLRHLRDRDERFDRLHDCLDLTGHRRRDDVATLAAFVIGNWEWRPEAQRLAREHAEEFAALITLARWYHGMTRKGRDTAFDLLAGEIRDMSRPAARMEAA